jgi:hypothetical protein
MSKLVPTTRQLRTDTEKGGDLPKITGSMLVKGTASSMRTGLLVLCSDMSQVPGTVSTTYQMLIKYLLNSVTSFPSNVVIIEENLLKTP